MIEPGKRTNSVGTQGSFAKRENILVFSSSHDYRQPRKANIHFITEALAKDHDVRFASVGYSFLNELKAHNPRRVIASKANRPEMVGNVECLLWKSPFHPVNLHRNWLAPISQFAHWIYRRMLSPELRRWIAEADIIIFECGLCSTLIPQAFKLNPEARIIYNASDGIEAIGADPILLDVLKKNSTSIFAARIPSAALSPELAFIDDLRLIPHAVHDLLFDDPGPSPYGPGRHVVSIGSMLFDPWVIEVLSRQFSEITFHLIGTGQAKMLERPNVFWYDEMPFAETLRYLFHSDVSLAPYRDETAPSYLKDTSMKLIQSDHYGIPSVCPEFATDGTKSQRFAYRPGDENGLVKAFRQALEAERKPAGSTLTWADVAARLIQ